MSLIQGKVRGVVPLQDGNESDLLLGKNGELIQAPIAAEYFNQALRQNLYSGNQAAAGAVVPIYTSTTQQCGLLNPAGSGVNLVPVRVNFGYVDTTGAAGSFALGYITGGGTIATGGKGVTAATTTTPANCYLGGKPAKGIFMSAGITTAAPSLLMQLGVNQLVTTAATTTATTFETKFDFNGTVVMPPDSAIFVAGNIAVLIKMAISILWIEVPIV